MSDPRPTDERLRMYERILASSRDHLSLVGEDFVYQVVNDAYLAAHALRRDEIEGRHVAELLGEETFETLVRPRLERALAGEVVEYEGWFEFAAKGRCAMSVAYFPYYGPRAERPSGVLVRATDITRERSMEQSLEAQGERLDVFLDVAEVGTWEWDISGDTIHWSPRVYELFGVSREEFDGRFESFAALVHEDDREPLAQAVQRALDHPDPHHRYEAEYRITAPDGSPRWQYARGAVLRDARGEPLRMLGIVGDVTRRKSLEAQLSHSQKLDAIGHLAGGIAHDFNNLLTAIVGSASLGRRARHPEDVARALDLITEAAGRATTLVRSLLTFARAQPSNPTTLDVVGLVRGLRDMLELLLPEHVELRLPPASPPLYARIDPAQLEQVVVNLVVNAKDAMPRGGRLEIAASRERVPEGDPLGAGAYVRLDVRDEGEGIPPELQSRVFEPFFSTKPTGRGTGLGRSTCHGVAERAGGGVRLVSSPGEGTTVSILLPEAEAADAEAPDDVSMEVPRGAGELVLLVEDDAVVRMTIAAVLEDLGYAVRSHPGGRAALEDADAAVGLLLSDVMMPDMTGPELVRTLRASRPGLPVVLTSGYALDPAELDAGVRFLAKPFSRRRLAEVVREALDEA